MTPKMTIRLLGSFSLACDELELTGMHTARLQGLLAYLLLRRGSPQSRQQLAFLFWPDSSETQAHTNLRQLLHMLRRRLPQHDRFLEVTDKTVCWHRDAPAIVDLAEFEARLAEAAGSEGSARVAALERAITSYGGDLLPGCYDDWLLPERERLLQRFLDALDELILLCERQREYDRAINHAERLLRHDPLQESAYRHLMRLHVAHGDRAAALRVYHTCVTVLERELGVPPGRQTVEAYQQLLALEGSAAPGPVAPGPSQLVGRQAEWRVLQDLWRSASHGGVYCACLSGEAGLGKTRLAEEMLHWARQQGIPAAATRAFAGGASLAYGPLVELLRSEVLRPRIARLPAVWRSELARLLPELLADDPELPRPGPLTERWQVLRMYDGIGRVLLRPDQPLVLLLDDLQWFDTETIAWLRYLICPSAERNTEAGPRPRLLVLACLRPEELDPEHPAERLLLELRCTNRLVELTLEPLSPAETAELAGSVAGRRLGPDDEAALYRSTDGNPLFVIETVRAVPVLPAGAGWELAPHLAPRVQAVIRLRLAQLSPPTKELAELAAVVGRSFTYDVLALASGLEEHTLVQSLDELWRRRIIREEGAGAYDFSHDHLRTMAYGDLSSARRRMLHGRLAAALETIHAGDTASVSGELAYHYERAGQVKPAIHYFRAAASHAYRVYAYSESIGFLNRGLDLIQAAPASARIVELELELQMELCMAWAVQTTYLGPQVEAAYRRAFALCGEVENLPHLFTVLWGLHEVALYRGEYAEGLDLAQRCLRIAEELDDPALWLEAHHAVWGAYYFLGQYEQALAHIERGLTFYDRGSHECLSVNYGLHDAADCGLHLSAMALWNMGLLDQAGRRLEQAIEHGHKLTLPANIADSCAYSGLVLHLLRDPVRAQSFAETAVNIGMAKGYPHSKLLGGMVLAWSLAAQGQAAQAVLMAQQSMAASGDSGQIALRSQFSAMAAEIHILAGRFREAAAIADAGIAQFVRFRDLMGMPDLWIMKGDALHGLGMGDDDIEACYKTAIALSREWGGRVSELRATVAMARLRMRQGQAAEGYPLLHEVCSRFCEGADTADLRIAHQLSSWN